MYIKIYILLILLQQTKEATDNIKLWILGGLVSLLFTILTIMIQVYFKKQSTLFAGIEQKFDQLFTKLNDLEKTDERHRVQLDEQYKRIKENEWKIKQLGSSDLDEIRDLVKTINEKIKVGNEIKK